MADDYSKCELTNTDKYYLLRRGDKDIRYDCFKNSASFDSETKQLYLHINSSFEYIKMKKMLNEFAEFEITKLHKHTDRFTEEEKQEHEQMRVDTISKNEKIFESLAAKYSISRDFFWRTKKPFIKKKTKKNNHLTMC